MPRRKSKIGAETFDAGEVRNRLSSSTSLDLISGIIRGPHVIIPLNALVLVATKPIDFRNGLDWHTASVRNFGADDFYGTLYAFCFKRAGRLKVI